MSTKLHNNVSGVPKKYIIKNPIPPIIKEARCMNFRLIRLLAVQNVSNRAKAIDHQVKFEVLFSGICHSDVHVGQNDFKSCVYPFVGGHEILGKVTEIGDKVTNYKIGDLVGCGVFVDACLECDQCKSGDDQYCLKGTVGTYNGDKKFGRVRGN